jgi:protocatechuate 3,4-dioxygenase beta subunit
VLNVLATVALACAASLDSKPPTPELLAKAIWVEGRIELPAGTPADERVEIVAHAVALPKFNDHAVAPDEKGSFKVAFAHDATRGRVQVRARYAFQDDEPTWRAGDQAPPFVLKPALGAWLTGQVAPPTPGAQLGRVEITLQGRPIRSGALITERTTHLAPDASFELGGLTCDCLWSATVVADGYQPLQIEAIPLEPGKHAKVAWTLRRGATLVGRVVDEAGNPIASATLDFDCRSEPLAPLPRDVADGLETNVDGSFRAEGLYPGDVLVRVRQPGFVASSTEFKELKDGETRSDVAIVLKKGLVLRGRVVDPEGAPVAGAYVAVVQREPGFGETVHDLNAGSDGSFACAGLGPGSVRIQAGKLPPGRVMSVELLNVDPATPDLVVKLVERFTLRGRVLDDLGRTVLRYTAGVRRIDPADPNPKPRTIDVKGKDGVFTIEGLDAGAWEVFVYGRGVVFEPARRVDVPHADEELVFVVRRPAVVSGRVLNADGTPAARALVEVEWDRPSMFGNTVMKEQTSVTTSTEGHFELTDIYPGHVRLTAASEDGRKAPAAAVDLSSGERRTDVLLRVGP